MKIHQPCEGSVLRHRGIRATPVLCGLIAAALLTWSPSMAHSQTRNWILSSVPGDWSNPLNWSGGAEPTSGAVVYITNGGTATISSMGEVCSSLNLGGTGSGTIQMTAGSFTAGSGYIGGLGTATFTHSGGTFTCPKFYVGLYYQGGTTTGSGLYELSGTAYLNSYDEQIGYSGMGTFTHTGGTNSCTSLSVGASPNGNPSTGEAYNLSGSGYLTASSENIGYWGSGTFTQSGGINACSTLSVGAVSTRPDASTVYDLGDGSLTASLEFIGSTGSGTLTQSGGINTVNYITISARGLYTLSGGTLNVSGGLSNQGAFDLSNSTAAINASAMILDLSRATLSNSQNMSLSLDGQSLLIVPAGLEPETYFAGYSNSGLLHHSGSTLTIASYYSFGGTNEIVGHVDCQGGTLSAIPGASITLNGGVSVSAPALLNLGNGSLYVDNAVSGMTGGSLTAANQYVGSTGSGVFDHSGGSNTTPNSLYLGHNPAGSGAYILGSAGCLNVASIEYIGNSGSGTLTQSGGTNDCSHLRLGYWSTGSGVYNLSGTGYLGASTEYVGYAGSGTCHHSGGTNTIANSLYVGYNSSGVGAYDLSDAGRLDAPSEYIGYSGAGTFTQSGGVNTAASIAIGTRGTYILTGGTLNVSAELGQQGRP